MIEKIQSLYKQLNHKTNFAKEVAEHFGKSPQYIRNSWFCALWGVPKEYQGEVIELMEEAIKKQNSQVA